MASWLRLPAVNKIIKTMIWSDFLLLSSSGFLAPIFAIFLTGQIAGATLATVGFAATIFWVVKSVVQIPVSWFADRTKGEWDDYAFMVAGSALGVVVPLLYYFLASRVWHVYAIEVVSGIANGMMVPTYLAIFTRHIDKNRENTEWMLHSNTVGIGYAAAAAAGGVLAEKFGFRPLFLVVAGILALGTLILVVIKKDIIESDRINGLADDGRAVKDNLRR